MALCKVTDSQYCLFLSISTSIISFNSTSVELWNALSGREFEVADVVAIIMGDYGQSEEVASRDAAAWVEKLREAKLIEE